MQIWKVDPLARCGGYAIVDGDGRSVAVVTQRDPHPSLGGGISHEQAMGNAHLFAAACDLLQALENLMGAYCEPDDRLCCSGIDCGCMGATKHQQAEHYARAAIAKARGEE